jgi:hypothetical protein
MSQRFDQELTLKQRLAKSRELRTKMLRRFGFIPTSVLKLSRGRLSQSMHNMQHEVPARNSAEQPRHKAKLQRLAEAGYSGAIPSDRKAGRGTLGLSIMPAEIVKFFANYYSTTGEVYLDPFMGHGVRMQVASMLDMTYYGYDASSEFFAYVDAVRSRLRSNDSLHITRGDSRFPDQIPDDVGDFCFTSPPYWDIEYYGDDPEQLGTGTTYEDFIDSMGEVAAAWLPKFKSDATFVVNVNDFRKDGTFYAYHADLIRAFVAAGWRLHDIWIVEGLVGGTPKAFAVDFNSMKIAPKVHEYALIFRKA